MHHILDGTPCSSLMVPHLPLQGHATVVSADFSNPLYVTPHLVALDHTRKCLVVAIRGSLSFRDAVVDLEADATPLQIPSATGGSPSTAFAHRGILKAAQRLQDQLDKEGPRASPSVPLISGRCASPLSWGGK